jgi:hypothetical protein
VAAQVVPRTMTPRLSGVTGEVAALTLVATIAVFLYLAGRSR